jgi:hypothetical protein
LPIQCLADVGVSVPGACGISGHPCGDDSAAEASVYLEIGVGGEKERIGQDFGETDETGIGDAHGDVAVFVQEIEDRNEGVLMESGDSLKPIHSPTRVSAFPGGEFVDLDPGRIRRGKRWDPR